LDISSKNRTYYAFNVGPYAKHTIKMRCQGIAMQLLDDLGGCQGLHMVARWLLSGSNQNSPSPKSLYRLEEKKLIFLLSCFVWFSITHIYCKSKMIFSKDIF